MDEPRRNDVFDRELRRALAAEGGVAAGPHVDAELAAAWMERQLDPVAARSIEAHLAGCQECQILMATLARLAPEAAPAAEGLAWWRRLRAGWIVPATVAAAAALVIWVAVPQQRRAAPAPADQFRARVEPAPAPPPAASEPAAKAGPEPAPEAARSADAQPPATAARRDARQAPREANGLEKKEADAAPPALERRERFADAAASPAAPAAAPAPAPQPPPAPPPAQAKALQESITLAGESAARANAQQDAANETQRSLRSAAGGVAGGRAQTALVIAAPDGARWRRAGAVLEFARRADAAFTATTMPVAADAINAGAAPGGTVCWLAGTNGVVLVSVDGVRFTRVAVPAAVNLVAITAADARGAVVTAADGRRFRTTDQGTTWSPIP